jgi:hypothetical protein
MCGGTIGNAVHGIVSNVSNTANSVGSNVGNAVHDNQVPLAVIAGTVATAGALGAFDAAAAGGATATELGSEAAISYGAADAAAPAVASGVADVTAYGFSEPSIGADYASSLDAGNAVVDPAGGYLDSGIGASNGAATNLAQSAATTATESHPFWSALGTTVGTVGLGAILNGGKKAPNAGQQNDLSHPGQISVGGTSPSQNPSIGSSAPKLSSQQGLGAIASSPVALVSLAAIAFFIVKKAKR